MINEKSIKLTNKKYIPEAGRDLHDILSSNPISPVF